MRKTTFLLLLFCVVLIESLLTTIPLVLVLLLVLYMIRRNFFVYLIAFLAGVLLDLFSVRTVGFSSLFFISFIFLISLYERKFETMTFPFVIFFSFFGSLAFLVFFGFHSVFWQSVTACVLSVLSVKLLLYFN